MKLSLDDKDRRIKELEERNAKVRNGKLSIKKIESLGSTKNTATKEEKKLCMNQGIST